MTIKQRRSAPFGRDKPQARKIDLWMLIGWTPDPTPGDPDPDEISGFVYDDDRREWKTRAVPFRCRWGNLDEDGHWDGPGVPYDPDNETAQRWRQEGIRRRSWLWLPSWYRGEPDEEGWEDDPNLQAGNEAFEGDPDLSAGDLVYATRIDNELHILEVPYTVWAFELKDALPLLNAEEDNQPVDAYKRDWDASAHGGWGGFVKNTSCIFKVADWRKVGYYGDAGANGAAEIRHCDNGVIGVVCDLGCPDE